MRVADPLRMPYTEVVSWRARAARHDREDATMSTTATATTSAVIYSVRDEMGRLLASGEYAPFVEDAAYNKACVLNPDRSTTTFTYCVDGEPHYSERKVCYKSCIRAGYPHHYADIIRDDRCIVDCCYYAWDSVHAIFDSEDDAIDYIMECIADVYVLCDDDETFEEFMDSELCYWHITPVVEWRQNARVARFGARSVIR